MTLIQTSDQEVCAIFEGPTVAVLKKETWNTQSACVSATHPKKTTAAAAAAALVTPPTTKKDPPFFLYTYLGTSVGP